MAVNTYRVLKTDSGNGLKEGSTVIPYYEDSVELILSSGPTGSHHIKKNGDYYFEHLAKVVK